MALLLVVEDNEMNADMLLRRLKRQGFKTAWAVNGVHALDLLESLRPNLILMDLSLPEMDGYQATRIIKGGPLRRIPIIVISAHDLSNKERSLLLQHTQLIIKKGDYSRQELVDNIETILDNQRDARKRSGA